MGNQWFLARDEVPEYIDPFTQLSEMSSESSIGDGQNLPDLTPEINSLDLDLIGFEWFRLVLIG